MLQVVIDAAESTWGSGIAALLYAPSLADDRQFVAWAARYERGLATPLEAREWVEMFDETDITHVLPHVNVPTLVVTPTDAGEFAPAASHYVAEHVPNATEVKVKARDQWPFGDGRAGLVAALDDFLGDRLHLTLTRSSGRRLAAVLFTDLVASTESLGAAGDRRWHSVLDAHDDLAHRVTARLGGRFVKSTGDGVLAVFDGPAAAVDAAIEILTALPRLGVQGRAGVHFGEIEDRNGDIAGIGVHLCSRILDLAQPGRITATTTVRDLVAGSGLQLRRSWGPRPQRLRRAGHRARSGRRAAPDIEEPIASGIEYAAVQAARRERTGNRRAARLRVRPSPPTGARHAPPARLRTVVLDCPDPLALAEFYRSLIGGEVRTTGTSPTGSSSSPSRGDASPSSRRTTTSRPPGPQVSGRSNSTST